MAPRLGFARGLDGKLFGILLKLATDGRDALEQDFAPAGGQPFGMARQRNSPKTPLAMTRSKAM